VTEWLLVLVSLLLVAACGVFVAAEFAFVTVDRAAVERRAGDGDRAAAGVRSALRRLSTQLSGAQLGITITNLLVGFLAEPAVAGLLEGPLTAAGVPEGAVPGIAVAVGLVLATGVTMVFGELVPKNLAIADPLRTARAVQGFQRAFTRVAGPLIALLNGSANRIVRAFGVEPSEELASARSPEELVSLVRRSAAQGTLPADTAALFVRSALFAAKRASDVLTPRPAMVTVGADDPVAAVAAAAVRTGRSRFPVLGEGLDDVVGVVHSKHVPRVPAADRAAVPVRDIMVPALFVPETVELDALLDQLRAEGLQLAVVVDEYGGTAGVVTLEDLVEELVGEVADEHDPRGSEFRARRAPDGSWEVSGLLRPDEVHDLTGIRVPEDAIMETLAGLVIHRLDRLPAVGDTVTVAGARLTVLRLDGRRVDRIRVVPTGASAVRPAGTDR
jgi:CBS domain containing-hemolysin-like protein